MAKTVFNLKNSLKNIFWSIFSVFAFKEAKEYILFQVKTYKMWNENFFVPHFRVTALIFWGLAPKERGYIKTWNFWNWGPTTIWHYCMSLILKVKKSLHPSVYSLAMWIMYQHCITATYRMSAHSCWQCRLCVSLTGKVSA